MNVIKKRIAREWKRYDSITSRIEDLEEEIASERNVDTIKLHIIDIDFYKRQRAKVSTAIRTLEWVLEALEKEVG